MFHPVISHLLQVTYVLPCLALFTPSFPRFTLLALFYSKLPTFHPVYPHLPQVTHVLPSFPTFYPS